MRTTGLYMRTALRRTPSDFRSDAACPCAACPILADPRLALPIPSAPIRSGIIVALATDGCNRNDGGAMHIILLFIVAMLVLVAIAFFLKFAFDCAMVFIEGILLLVATIEHGLRRLRRR